MKKLKRIKLKCAACKFLEAVEDDEILKMIKTKYQIQELAKVIINQSYL